MQFTQQQVDAGIRWMLDSGNVGAGRPVKYTAILEAAGVHLPPPGFLPQLSSVYMEAVHWRCQEQGLPPIDALVVNADGDRRDRPGTGYFSINGHADPLDVSVSREARDAALAFWAAQQEECRFWRAP